MGAEGSIAVRSTDPWCEEGRRGFQLSKLGKMSGISGPAWSIVLRYGVALTSVAAAFGLTLTFTHFNLPQPFGAFALSAIGFTFWYAGAGPGILSPVLSSLNGDYLFDSSVKTESR